VNVHDAAIEVEAGHLAEHDVHVPTTPQRLPERQRNLDRRQRPRCHLVDERLEQEVVLPVDERDVDVRAAQGARRKEPAEAASDDDDPRHARIAPSSCRSFSFVSRPPA
jgi:hypothetical protein